MDAAARAAKTCDESTGQWVALPALVCGAALLAIYFYLEQRLARGVAEFAYWPPLEPLPFAPMRGFTFEQLARHVGRLMLLGPALLLVPLGIGRWVRFRSRRLHIERTALLVICGAALVVSTAVMAGVIQGRAIVDDELTYAMQARLLADGRLAEDSVPPWGYEPFTIWTRLGATGKYLFGEPLIQLPGTLLEQPALVHLLLAGLTLLLWHRVVKEDAGSRVAAWAVTLVAFSPMFLLTTPTGMSHPSSLFCIVLAAQGYQWVRRERPWLGAVVVGSALGFGLTVRPQVVAPAGLVLGAATALALIRRRRLGAVGGLVLAGGLWLAAIGLYNHALTGSALTLPWYLEMPLERYGFGQIVANNPYVHTPWKAIENLLVVAVRFNGWWLGWPLSLGLVLVWARLGRPRQGLGLWSTVGLAIILFHVPYYSTGVSDTGPVYYYELLLPASLLGAHAVVAALERWPRQAWIVILIHFGVGTTSFLIENVARLDRLITAIHTPAEHILRQLEPPALLITETSARESLQSGWVFSFPARYRHDSDPIVTYPRGEPQHVVLLRERYSYRECWYYRVEPQTISHQLLRCADAQDLLERSQPASGPPLWLRYPPTAVRLGLLEPFAAGLGPLRE